MNLNVEEMEGMIALLVWVPWSLDPLLNGPRGRLAHVVKRHKPTYHIKARGHHLDRRILKKVKMSSHGLASG